jgi:hypothetical protein
MNMNFSNSFDPTELTVLFQRAYDHHLANSCDSSVAWDALISEIVNSYLKINGTRKPKSRLFRIYYLIESLIVSHVRAERALIKKTSTPRMV